MKWLVTAFAIGVLSLASAVTAAPPSPEPNGTPIGCEWRSPPPETEPLLFCKAPWGETPAWAPFHFNPGTIVAAGKGDPVAMTALGEFYVFGPNVARDPAAAASLLTAAAAKGDALAMVDLGALSTSGVGVPKDPAAAGRWYRRALDSGDADALDALATRYVVGADVDRDGAKAIELYRAAIDKGSLDAVSGLAALYGAGKAVPEDDAEAIRLFRIGVAKNDPKSLAGLGLLYFYGKGVTKDAGEAMQRLRHAADLGNGTGMFGVGLMYLNGLSTPKDVTVAVAWFQRAANRGNPAGMYSLGVAYADGHGVTQDDKEAIRWLRAAENAGFVAASVALGHLLATARTDVPAELTWLHTPSRDDISANYPIGAAIAGIAGEVVYECTLSATLTPTDCQVVAEQPGGYGFAAAGLALMSEIQLKSGLAPGSKIKLPIRFALETPANAPQPVADRCAAYAIASVKVRTYSGLSAWRTRYWPALSKYYAVKAGHADTPNRLADEVAEMDKKVADDRVSQEYVLCGF